LDRFISQERVSGELPDCRPPWQINRSSSPARTPSRQHPNLSLFDDNPAVKRTFCPPPECYDPIANADFRYGVPLPSFSWLIERGAVCALNFPIGMNPGLAKALGVMMKLDFQRAVLNRIPDIEAHPEQYFRQVLFLCDEEFPLRARGSAQSQL
jgi:hypothetical protein